MKASRIARLVMSVFIGVSLAAFSLNARADVTLGPFTYHPGGTAGTMNLWGNLTIKEGTGTVEADDVIGAFVSDVTVNGGCVGAGGIAQITDDTHAIYGTVAVNGNDPTTPEKDGADAGDTITFKYYSKAQDKVFEFPNVAPESTVTFTSGGGPGQFNLSPEDITLPVELSAFNATFDSKTSRVTLKWRTESEISNFGFNVYRSEGLDGKYVKVNSTAIKGAGTVATPHDYQFVDSKVEVGKTYFYYLEDISFTGEKTRSRIIRVTIDKSGKLHVTGLERPTTFVLLQNYPNPFNPETWIPFRLAKDTDVTIRIYNTVGKLVRTLHLGKMPVGVYHSKTQAAHWDGKDNFGDKVSSGVYFYNLTAGNFSATKKLVILK